MDREYIETNITPSLSPALTALCRARPEDPVTWLANYLLANKPTPPTKPPPLVPTEAQPTAEALLALVHSGKKSCVDIVSERLARIEAVEGTLGACPEILTATALEQAKAVDLKVAAGKPLRRLEGLPIVVKINVDIAGTLTTAATPALAEWKPTKTSPCVAPLLAEGAIVLAKTAMCEMAVGFRGGSALHGMPKCPYSLEHNAGGSSTGTAVAIAAGIVPCGIGSDTAGSLRVPAACNGGVGLRPSKGRWPGVGVVPCATLRDTPGPMGATVADVALLDAVLHNEPPVVAPPSLMGHKVVIASDWLAAGPALSDEAKAALDAAVVALEKAGAAVVTEEGFLAVREVAKHTWNPPLPVPVEDTYEDLQAYLDYHGTDLPEELRTVAGVRDKFGNGTPIGGLLKGFFAPSTEKQPDAALWQAKLVERDAAIKATEAAYRRFFIKLGASAVILPTFPGENTRLDANPAGTLFNEGAYSSHLCTISGAPSISLPTKVTWPNSGIPVSVMLWGTDDRKLLALALALERAL